MCYVAFGSFGYRSKVVAKGVRNSKKIGYSITIVMGEHSWCTGSYRFKRDWGFASFPCVLNVITVCSKIFAILRLFTFLH